MLIMRVQIYKKKADAAKNFSQKACWKRYDTIVGNKGTAHIKKMIKT